MANRPPDAVLDPTDVATLAWQQLEEMERRIRAEMARRDKIEDDLLNLVALRQNNESKRAATLDWFADRLLRAREREQAQRSMVNRLIWYGGPILAGFTALLAMTNVWRLFP